MAQEAEAGERELRGSLSQLGERFRDEEFSTELYRALTNNVWRKVERPEWSVALSWRRAEALVNDLRGEHGEEALELAQSGGEGEVSDVVADELGRLGWSAKPLDTSRRDERHLSEPESAPAGADGESELPEWERVARAEADEAQRRPSAQGRPGGPA